MFGISMFNLGLAFLFVSSALKNLKLTQILHFNIVQQIGLFALRKIYLQPFFTEKS